MSTSGRCRRVRSVTSTSPGTASRAATTGGPTSRPRVSSPLPLPGAARLCCAPGDRVRMRQDGLIEFVGRSGDQVKIRGYRVELAEVESVLARYHGLAHAVVVTREVEDGEKRLIAYVVAEAGQVDTVPFDIGGLRAHATELLPEY